MEITKEALIVGETILLDKDDIYTKRMYLGNAGLVHFISSENNYKKASGFNLTIEVLQELFTIEEPKSKVVPLELKIYDFVDVRYRDNKEHGWENGKLVFVNPKHSYPYYILRKDDITATYKYCEFI